MSTVERLAAALLKAGLVEELEPESGIAGDWAEAILAADPSLFCDDAAAATQLERLLRPIVEAWEEDMHLGRPSIRFPDTPIGRHFTFDEMSAVAAALVPARREATDGR